jgi:hypothetical protein
MIYKIILFIACTGLMACARPNSQLYSNIPENEDGVVDVILPADPAEPPADYTDWFEAATSEQLTVEEAKLIKKYIGASDRISFLIVDARRETVQRSFGANRARVLASNTKLFTSIAALENVSGIEVNRVKAMLKTSDNSAASKYVRLAAKAIDNTPISGNPYSGHSSCPSSSTLARERPAAASVLRWVKSRVQGNWLGGGLMDGAGCDYGNIMTPGQVISLLRYADRRGKAYAGQSYEQLLSISGVDGTWGSRNRDAKGRVLAKTGTLSTASNLSGYFYANRNGAMNKYYFSVLINKSSKQSPTQTRTLTEGLVRYWLQYYASHETTAFTKKLD